MRSILDDLPGRVRRIDVCVGAQAVAIAAGRSRLTIKARDLLPGR